MSAPPPAATDPLESPDRKAPSSRLAPAAPRTTAPVWFFGHLAAMLALHFAAPIVQWNLGASRWLGLPFALVGFALVAGGARRFSPVTTLRPWEAPSVLVTDGMHRWSRNPMYLGLLLSLVGAFVMLGSGSPVLAIPSLAWLLHARFVAYEEYALEARFGDAYRRYRARVRRWL